MHCITFDESLIISREQFVYNFDFADFSSQYNRKKLNLTDLYKFLNTLFHVAASLRKSLDKLFNEKTIEKN